MTLDDKARAHLAKARPAAISDAMERLGMPRTVIVGFGGTRPQGGAVVGTAYTIRQVPKHFPAQHDQRLTRHKEASTSLAQPGDFVVVDANARMDIASWGGNHSARCHGRGVAGVLINGCTRDSDEIRAMGFPAFYLGTSPIASQWNQETAELNGIVVVGGVQIRPGDIIVGDGDGLVVLAPEQLPAILTELKP
ncbi:RraA family protein [Devosia sp. XGJD_8]|uniref:RraA family protein n=1 Tax=Devosia sp. XGJD_8 TaxID=3391187 RepID=UPI0039847E3F